METFVEQKELVANPFFEDQRRKNLSSLSEIEIEKPIGDIISGMNNLPYCFTLQCCFGHFLYPGQTDPHMIRPLPEMADETQVEYRIAYIAFCVENSEKGRNLLTGLRGLEELDPENVQFGSADWFWRKQVNSYVIQVEPDRFKYCDKAILEYREALRIEKIRDRFFTSLEKLI